MNIAIIDDDKDIREKIEEIVLEYYSEKGEKEIKCQQFANG